MSDMVGKYVTFLMVYHLLYLHQDYLLIFVLLLHHVPNVVSYLKVKKRLVERVQMFGWCSFMLKVSLYDAGAF